MHKLYGTEITTLRLDLSQRWVRLVPTAEKALIYPSIFLWRNFHSSGQWNQPNKKWKMIVVKELEQLNHLNFENTNCN